MILAVNFIFETFDEAMNVHKKLFQIIREKGYVSYADLYCCIYENYEVTNLEWFDYGWFNLYTSNVKPYGTDGFWVLEMPEDIQSINNKIF